jgi:TonB family protein
MKSSAVIGTIVLALSVGCGAGAAWSQPKTQAPPAAPVATDEDGETGLPLEGVITNPDWVQLPGGDEMSRFYPPIASALSISGFVTMVCSVNSLGMVENCKVANETPAGIGFGAAALQMASYFRMKPRTVNGASVSGAKVNIPFRFNMDNQASEAEPAASAAAPPTPRALDLARRLSLDLASPDQIRAEEEQVGSYMRRLADNGPSVGGVDPDKVEIAIQAIDEASEAALPVWREKMAQAYARTFSETELAGMVAFFDGPAGVAWRNRQGDIAKILQDSRGPYQSMLQKDAGARFCQKVACSTPKPPLIPTSAAPK